jgi:hypothetical protein
MGRGFVSEVGGPVRAHADAKRTLWTAILLKYSRKN